MSRKFFIIILAMMTMSGLMASDIYLPALPKISYAFSVNIIQTQQSFSTFLLGLAFGQLIYGLLSDRFGRKKILIIGISIFVLASLGCTLSPSLSILLVSRFFQALGACSGMVIGRTIVSDKYDVKEAGKIFTLIFPIMGLSPSLSPLLGGYLASYFGWRTVFAFTLMFGLILLGMIMYRLQETKDFAFRINLKIKDISNNYISILKSKRFFGYTITVCCAYAAYFAYLAESPFIFNYMGFNTKQIGYFYLTIGLFYLLGNYFSRKLIQYITINKALLIGYSFFIIGSTFMIITSIIGISTPAFLFIPMSIVIIGEGFLLPLGIASVITLYPEKSGYASGMMGFFQLCSAALAAALIGYFTKGSALSMALIICGITLTGITTFISLIIYGKNGLNINKPVTQEAT